MKNSATMDLTYIEGDTFSQFVENNMPVILKEWNYSSGKTKFFQSAKATPHSLQESFENLFLIIGQDKPGIQKQHLIQWAEETARKRARSDFPIYHSLEVFLEFRDIFWQTLHSYLEFTKQNLQTEYIFELERYYNQAIDFVIYHFATLYVEHKQELVRLQQAAAKEPIMPVIALTNEIGLLTLIGSMNRFRLEKWMEDTIQSINQLKLIHIILDISHASFENSDVFQSFIKVTEGVKWIGCQVILTGIKPHNVQHWIKQGELPSTELSIFPTVKQALNSLGSFATGNVSIRTRTNVRKVKRMRHGTSE